MAKGDKSKSFNALEIQGVRFMVARKPDPIQGSAALMEYGMTRERFHDIMQAEFLSEKASGGHAHIGIVQAVQVAGPDGTLIDDWTYLSCCGNCRHGVYFLPPPAIFDEPPGTIAAVWAALLGGPCSKSGKWQRDFMKAHPGEPLPRPWLPWKGDRNPFFENDGAGQPSAEKGS